MPPVGRNPSSLFRITPRCDTIHRFTPMEVNLTISQATKIAVIVPRVISSASMRVNRARAKKKDPPNRYHNFRHGLLCILPLWLVPRHKVNALHP